MCPMDLLQSAASHAQESQKLISGAIDDLGRRIAQQRNKAKINLRRSNLVVVKPRCQAFAAILPGDSIAEQVSYDVR